VIDIKWRCPDLGYSNDRLIQIETMNLKFVLSHTAELIRNEVVSRYLETLKDKSRIYPIGDNNE